MGLTKLISDSKKADFGGEYEPIMEILETYDESDASIRYSALALDLLAKTKDARIKRYTEEQGRKYVTDRERLKEAFRGR